MAKAKPSAPDLPLVGQISDYLDRGAPRDVRKTIEKAGRTYLPAATTPVSRTSRLSRSLNLSRQRSRPRSS